MIGTTPNCSLLAVAIRSSDHDHGLRCSKSRGHGDRKRQGCRQSVLQNESRGCRECLVTNDESGCEITWKAEYRGWTYECSTWPDDDCCTRPAEGESRISKE